MTTGQPILKILVRFTSIRKRQKLFTYYNSCFIVCWQRPGLVYQAISYWQNHARMANSQNVAISGEISSTILNIWCRFIGEKVFEIINSQKSHANWICYDGWTPLDQPRFGFPVGEVPTCTWRFNSLLPIMTPFQFNSFICHKNTSIHQHINAFTIKWSEGLRNLKGLYIPIQIQLFYRNTTLVIAAVIKWQNY